jgi:hypothetical protein
MRVVGMSTAESAGGRLVKGRWLTGGVREPARANGRSTLIERAHRTERGNERVRERIGADRPVPPGSGRGRGRERVRGRR